MIIFTQFIEIAYRNFNSDEKINYCFIIRGN